MNAPKVDIWMPLYVAEYLADTTHLTYAEHGVYLLLIMTYWRRKGPLKDNDNELASIAKVSFCDWPAMRLKMADFFQIADGVWRHRRIDAELKRASTLKQSRKTAGELGAEARWAKKWQTQPSANDLPKTKTIANDGSSPSPSPSHINNPLTHLQGAVDEVYSVYPKKVAPKAAKRVIERAIKKHGKDLVLARTRQFAAAWSGRDLQFCPHPSTWFNQERYDDDPSTWVQKDAPVPPHVQLKAIEQSIAIHPANRESMKYEPKCSDDQKADLKNLRNRLQELYRKIAQTP